MTLLAPHDETVRRTTVRPATGRPKTDRWERVCRVDELEPSWGEAVLVRMKQIALFLFAPDEIYAVSHRDPHTSAYVMARGIVGSKGERPTVASPLHKEVYDLGTGECFSDPGLLLKTYRTRVVGGFIEIEIED
jgi:nitrite reductase (NADH) small subunit